MKALIFLAVLVLACALGVTIESGRLGDGRHAADRFFAFLSAFVVAITTLLKECYRRERRRRQNRTR